MLLSSEPAVMDDLIVPLRESIAAVILLVVVLRLADRIRRASRLLRLTLVPVLVFAMLRTLAVAWDDRARSRRGRVGDGRHHVGHRARAAGDLRGLPDRPAPLADPHGGRAGTALLGLRGCRARPSGAI